MMTRTTMMTRLIVLGIGLAMTGPAAHAQFGFVSGSDGSDGPFNPPADFEVDLSLAATGPWDTTNGGGNGVYDPTQWAIVFKFTTINIPSGVTVTFKNHPKNPPVVWLAQGDVTIDGTVNLDGKFGSAPAFEYVQPGPGGFAGGMNRSSQGNGSGGFGPTGGQRDIAGRGGSYGYGNSQILPLIGGSGGGGDSHTTFHAKGGGGGGAILIASSSQITFNGSIAANGGGGGNTGRNSLGGGGGSGGAIRLIANIVSGTGGLRAAGGAGGSRGGHTGGVGRIRVEAADYTLTDAGSPGTIESAAMGPVFPPAGVAATIKVVTIDGEPVPAEPNSGILTVETAMGNPAPVPVVIQASNIPDGTSISVILVPARGAISIQSGAATINGGTGTAMVTFPAGRNEIQVRANW